MFSQTAEEIIIWMLIFTLVIAIPVTLYYFGILQKKNSDSIQAKLHRPIPPPRPVAVKVNLDAKLDFNFTNNWAAQDAIPVLNNDTDGDQKISKLILKTVATNGEMGMQAKQISDLLHLHNIEVNYSLSYLVDKRFIELVNSQKGDIYYLSELGIHYCHKKGYIAQLA